MIAYFDIFSGISGDMTLGAFVDLGVPVKWLESKLQTTLSSEVTINSETILKNGLSAQNLIVKSLDNSHPRDYQKITKLISESAFSMRVKDLSLAAFEKIAAAEAKIHSKDIGNVHFHEVGAVDSIVDIIGTFLCIEYLNIDTIYASKIVLGSGLVECSHGIIPIPAPATLAILKGVPVKPHEGSGEMVTPTGAAIITTLTEEFGKMPEMRIKNIGYGAGKNDLESRIPNLLRIIVGEDGNDNGKRDGQIIEEELYVIETTIDDMPPEYSGYIFEKLFNTGALDVCHIPVQMKKNRPGTRVEVICKKENLYNIIDIIFQESTTTGIRFHKVKRAILKRERVKIKTKFGEIFAKKVTNPDNSIEIMPEYEEMKKIAKNKNIPLKKVYSQVNLDISSM